MPNNCGTCRFWSEMVAALIGTTHMECLCLCGQSPNFSEYITGEKSCGHWKHNRHGSVDAPPNYGEESRAAYEAEEGVDGE